MANPLQAILHPRSVVVAGASNNFMKMGSIQALNLLSGGFRGEIVFLHPREREVLGRPAYPEPAALPLVPDLALLVTPTRVTPDLLDRLGAHGVRHAVVVTAGFREMGPEGARLEEELVAAARRHGMRFLGPNCIGVLNPHLGLNLTVCPYTQRPGRLGLASQSGTYVAQTLPYLRDRGIRYSRAISIGNAADIDLVDCLEYLGNDPDTAAIAIYMEGIRRGRAFIETARRVAANKPIVALYVGGTKTGARSGMSHTGSLGGPDALYNGIFEQAGVLRAPDVESLFGWGAALANQPLPRGRRVAILTHSGGPATSMADACERAGLALPELSPALQERLRPHLEHTASSKNPIDLTFSMAHEEFTERIPEILFASDEVDGILLHGLMDTGFMKEMYHTVQDRIRIPRDEFLRAGEFDVSKLLAMPGRFGKPLVASNFLRDDHAAQAFRDGDIPLFLGPEQAVFAMGALARCAEIRARLAGAEQFAAEADVQGAGQRLDPGVLPDDRAFQLLAGFGILTAQYETARTLPEARAAAERIGYPVVLKGLIPGVAHKTERGLVHVDLRTPDELAAAWEATETAAPGCWRIVMRQVRGRRELVAGMTRAAGFGPCVMLGIGGVFTETIRDATFRAAPVSRDDARRMPDSLRLAGLFAAQRGEPAVDREALADVLQGLSRLALEYPEIREIDVNPLVVENGRPIAVDALVVVGEKG